MSPLLSIGLAYYRNPGMLSEQLRVWAGYPEALKAQVEVIVIDDASPEPAVDVPRPPGLPTLTIGRLADVADPFTPPWRQDAARNRAANEAMGTWLLLTDMDHVLPADSLAALLAHCAEDRDVVYEFRRLDAPDLTPKRDGHGRLHPHPNSFCLRRARYWAIGGYDEEYCGIYGTDGPWRRRMVAQSTLQPLEDVAIVRYPREVIPDASTRVDRKQVRTTNNPAVLRRMHQKEASGGRPVTLSIPWQRQYSKVAVAA